MQGRGDHKVSVCLSLLLCISGILLSVHVPLLSSVMFCGYRQYFYSPCVYAREGGLVYSHNVLIKWTKLTAFPQPCHPWATISNVGCAVGYYLRHFSDLIRYFRRPHNKNKDPNGKSVLLRAANLLSHRECVYDRPHHAPQILFLSVCLTSTLSIQHHLPLYRGIHYLGDSVYGRRSLETLNYNVSSAKMQVDQWCLTTDGWEIPRSGKDSVPWIQNNITNSQTDGPWRLLVATGDWIHSSRVDKLINCVSFDVGNRIW